MLLHPTTALAECLRMNVQAFDVFFAAISGKAILDWQNDLRNDFQVAVHEHVERVRDDAFGGIFHRHNAIVRGLLADLGKNIRDGLLR